MERRSRDLRTSQLSRCVRKRSSTAAVHRFQGRVSEPDEQGLGRFGVEGADAVDEQGQAIDGAVLRAGRFGPRLVVEGSAMDRGQQVAHRCFRIVRGEVLEPGEHLADTDGLGGLGDEPLVQEQGAAGHGVAPGPDFLLPECGLEELPVLLVGGLTLMGRKVETLKDKVLDEVGSGQRRTPGVESLEDLLAVLVGLELDHHQLQSVKQQRGSGPRRATRRPARRQPVSSSRR